MTTNAYVRVRIDPALKEEAALVLNSLGLTISDVMRMTLTRIARDKELPLALARPNLQTLAAMEEARAIKASRRSRFETAGALFNALDAKTPAARKKMNAA
ncbi:type II toxin-antitoxin system RelB/DinJ family antitoxin [Pararhizobium sp.]|uniref:type II toxin-antitoxin system RelB/DinJ family antitoxin n=1 Tax=Pararhizobium sp. TaxID=1977563 RepID=UPI0027193064|nr:type II toxin-antitoxin system RelB/DinJ family antitoxin [Pararhizobium sp.]MDO9415045.1 type II toxin-antitoxin system RelB/DinJ family antitoxin [Pararhizobium sp.]